MPKILIAEDDLMIADMIEEFLIDEGYEVCGIARTVDQALAIARTWRPDIAILDMRLAEGGLGTDIAKQWHDGPRIGVLYASGNVGVLPASACGDACISKPYHMANLVTALKIVEGIVTTGTALPPFPPGFRLLGARQTIAPERLHA